MPRARRNKLVSLTQTKKKSMADKESFADTVRETANRFNYAWLFSIGNSRNAYIKDVRLLWEGSRIFFGKLGVIRVALGMDEQSELRPGLSALSNVRTCPIHALGNTDIFSCAAPGRPGRYPLHGLAPRRGAGLVLNLFTP